ncbi:hypothetical protein VitviT2T_007742 [Vitis vinifera]|uniref:IQ domain-containing protein IQM2 n=2 Tax=Vitis vinifera TaxID=29760 RepID=A0ABY9C0B7_VITVI|nr:IQ domain-containing protein IQM2 isoform X2 [Vitis vinifera]WJZ88444.1 hypothetical protein VitviT2T_007742 [Vitis vinifera]|eukprot:XP_010651374.1 PREDICTED: IQ domain-containing protein IQM2 isoform X2 [Vitis vinifera]
MGISFSCPFSESNDLETGLESVVVKSISFGDNEVKTAKRSVSFNGRNSEPTIMRSLGSGKMILEGSVSFERGELETKVLIKAPSLDKEKSMITRSASTEQNQVDNYSSRSDITTEMIPRSPLSDSSHPKHEAALKLQKVYKSFRTRRKLADCAVLIVQNWWQLLDFAELKHSSISFFEIEKHESAISRWSRARTRAAKVGKGLSKSDRAQKLALQHWLEAIDPRHRYGHNLHFYYVQWLHCQSREPFFYWLDIGEGREVNIEKCPRSKLQQQCIKYLGPMERKTYEVVVEGGKLFYKQTGELLDTTGESKDAKWIFVLSTSKTLYVGKKKKGTFQHSSFLAGGATSAAGRLVVENGILKAVWPHSGHYRPTEENFQDFVSFLKENNVDLTDVKMSPADGEDEELVKQSSVCLRSLSSEEDLTDKAKGTEENLNQEKIGLAEAEPAAVSEMPKSWRSSSLGKSLTNIKIPKRGELFQRSENGNLAAGPGCGNDSAESPLGGYESEEEETTVEQDYMPPKRSLVEEEEEHDIKATPKESILRRINSQKGMELYQLGRQLSCKWTTGAGPRISCVRDHPSKLQVRALEHVNLSPRSAGHCRSEFSPRSSIELNPPKVSTPISYSSGTPPPASSPVFEKGVLPHRSIHHSKTPFSPLSRGSDRSTIFPCRQIYS